MGCTYAESTLQPARVCLEVTPYRSDLKGYCRSHQNLGTARCRLDEAVHVKTFSPARCVVRPPRGFQHRKCHDITRRAGMSAAQNCLLAWCCCCRCRSRFRVPSAG